MSTLFSRRALLAGGGVLGIGAAAGLYALSGPGGRIREGRGRGRPVRTLNRPPASADVVVIGGGIIGAATAFELARRGVSVVLCEKGVIAGEASSRSVGQVSSSALDPVKLELLNRAKLLWDGYNEAVQGETGFRASGYLSPIPDAETQGFWEGWMVSAGKGVPNARFLSRRELAKHLTLDGNWTGAFYDPSDGCAEPTLAAPAIAEAAARLGAKLVAPCAVRGIETSGGRISHVVTEHGPIRASTVVLAGGGWSSLFADSIDLYLPILNAFSMCRTVSGVKGPKGSGDLPTATWRTQIDGNHTISVIGGIAPITPSSLRYSWAYRHALREAHWDLHLNLSDYFFSELMVPQHWALDQVSPFERLRIMEPTTNPVIAKQAVNDLQRSVPAFRSMKLGELWSGAIAVTPDNMPTMSAVPSKPGLFLATGFTYGLTMAPAAGEAMAQLVTGEKPTIDLRPYRYQRYTDGSPLRFTA